MANVANSEAVDALEPLFVHKVLLVARFSLKISHLSFNKHIRT
jgi:hypothetical protein